MVSVGGGKSGVLQVRALLSNSDVISAVLTHAYCFTLEDRERKRRMMNHYLGLVATVPIFDVCLQSGLANLPAILDAIGQALGENALPGGQVRQPS